MAREIIKISESKNKKVNIYVDSIEANEILPFLFKKKNLDTFIRFQQLVFENLRNNEIYKKENISDECSNLYALRFMKGLNQNDRIYCIENNKKKRNIILAKLYQNKRTQKIDKKIKAIVKPICSYNYEL